MQGGFFSFYTFSGMKKICVFAGSNSSTSINKRLVVYASEQLKNVSVSTIDLTNFPLPMYSEDHEREKGFPEALSNLLEQLHQTDAVLLSVNEHNGTVSAFFKNILDWLSRIEYKFLNEKKILLLSTSPGKRGGLSALEYIQGVLPRFGASEIITFRLPSFHENFKDGEISDATLKSELIEKIALFESNLL